MSKKNTKSICEYIKNNCIYYYQEANLLKREQKGVNMNYKDIKNELLKSVLVTEVKVSTIKKQIEIYPTWGFSEIDFILKTLDKEVDIFSCIAQNLDGRFVLLDYVIGDRIFKLKKAIICEGSGISKLIFKEDNHGSF